MKTLTSSFVPGVLPHGPGTLPRLWSGTAWAFLGAAALVLLVLVPICNLAVPEGSFFHVSTTTVSLIGKIMCYAIVALAMDLIWGYTGILSLGHGLFFALGGYAMGMYLMRSIGRDGVYKSDLPDFMVFLDWKQLPWYWSFTDSFWYCMLLVVLVPGILAFVFGFFAFRSRIKGVYFSIITQALTYAFMLLFFRNDTGFGGNNGFTDFKRILGFPIAAPETRMVLFMVTAAALHRIPVPRPRDRAVQARAGAHRHPRCGDARDVLGLQTGLLQALHLDALARDLRHRGRLYVPQVGHHQSERDVARQLDRDRDLGARSAGAARSSARDRRGGGQPRQELVHAGAARVLALRAGPAVHPRHALSSARHRGLWIKKK
jgi:hypothetical protein